MTNPGLILKQRALLLYSAALFLLLFMFALPGCHSEREQVGDDFDKYKFDPLVIAKLPLYDSLIAAIITNSPSFQKFIRDEDGHRSFTYLPFSTDDPDVFIKLPPAAAPAVDPYFNRLGKDFIYGFEIFRDSSIKVYVRKKITPGSKVHIWENLSYYPKANIRPREFPDKDSILNRNWQYWVRFSRESLF